MARTRSLLSLAVLLSAGCWDWDAAAANLMPNPGCEIDAEHWTRFHSVISRNTTVARSGVASCEATADSTEPYTIDGPVPDYVPEQGAIFEASVFVRSDSSVGSPITLWIREWVAGTAAGQGESEPTSLTTSWQQLRATLTIGGSDREEIDIYVGQGGTVTPGDSFQVDDAILVRRQ